MFKKLGIKVRLKKHCEIIGKGLNNLQIKNK